MDIYNSQGRETPLKKKIEHFFRKAFLISSSIFAFLVGIILLDKTDTIANFTEPIAIPLVFVWFSSFVGWVIFLIVNSKLVKIVTSRESAKSRKVGFMFLYLWLIGLVSFILLGIFQVESPFLIITTFAVTILFLPIAAFLLGNKIVKIISILPLGFILLSFLIYLFIVRPHKIKGTSMTPSMPNNEYFLSEKVSYYFRSPKRGDIILFAPPISETDEFIARVIGLPNEYISIINGEVYINNKILSEPYLADGITTDTGVFLTGENILIPEDSYVVMGDNRPHASDSRNFGFVKRSAISGRAWYVYWPSSEKGFVD